MWTAGRGIADWDGPVWVWMPLQEMIVSEQYWDPGQPNIHSNYSGMLMIPFMIAVDSQSTL